jgi:hypothetical protein
MASKPADCIGPAEKGQVVLKVENIVPGRNGYECTVTNDLWVEMARKEVMFGPGYCKPLPESERPPECKGCLLADGIYHIVESS